MPRARGETDARSLVGAFRQLPPEVFSIPDAPVRLPMTVTSTGGAAVEVMINGQKREFLLDTGAGVSIVASDVAAELGLEPIGSESTSAQTATTRTVALRPTVIPRLRIGAIEIGNHPAGIIDHADLELRLLGLFTIVKIDGIIGWPALSKLHVELDFANRQVVLKKPDRPRRSNANFFWLGCPLVRIAAENRYPLNFGVDTGSRDSSATASLLRKLRPAGVARRAITTGSAGGLETAEADVIADMTLVVGATALRFENLATTHEEPTAAMQADGTLGVDVARNGRLIIDYENGRYEIVHAL